MARKKKSIIFDKWVHPFIFVLVGLLVAEAWSYLKSGEEYVFPRIIISFDERERVIVDGDMMSGIISVLALLFTSAHWTYCRFVKGEISNSNNALLMLMRYTTLIAGGAIALYPFFPIPLPNPLLVGIVGAFAVLATISEIVRDSHDKKID